MIDVLDLTCPVRKNHFQDGDMIFGTDGDDVFLIPHNNVDGGGEGNGASEHNGTVVEVETFEGGIMGRGVRKTTTAVDPVVEPVIPLLGAGGESNSGSQTEEDYVQGIMPLQDAVADFIGMYACLLSQKAGLSATRPYSDSLSLSSIQSSLVSKGHLRSFSREDITFYMENGNAVLVPAAQAVVAPIGEGGNVETPTPSLTIAEMISLIQTFFRPKVYYENESGVRTLILGLMTFAQTGIVLSYSSFVPQKEHNQTIEEVNEEINAVLGAGNDGNNDGESDGENDVENDVENGGENENVPKIVLVLEGFPFYSDIEIEIPLTHNNDTEVVDGEITGSL